jgi:hypothetical protein
MPVISLMKREAVLRYASGITERRDNPIAVRANALPMIQWLEGAATDDDLQARFGALSRQHSNTSHMEPTDDPPQFIAAAEQYYAFLSA